jgi:mono/diheme cytochrome c family protein
MVSLTHPPALEMRWIIMPFGLLALSACASMATPAASGERLARDLCSGCHAIGATDTSANRLAPPLRDVLTRYDETQLTRELQSGALMGHPPLPTVHLSSEGAQDLVAYLRTLQPTNQPRL